MFHTKKRKEISFNLAVIKTYRETVVWSTAEPKKYDITYDVYPTDVWEGEQQTSTLRSRGDGELSVESG